MIQATSIVLRKIKKAQRNDGNVMKKVCVMSHDKLVTRII